MFCNQCGASLPDGSKFCNVCGAQMITYENVQAQGNVQDVQGQNYAQETYAQPQGAAQSPVDRTAQMNVNPNVPMQAVKQASKSLWPIIGGAVAAVAVVTGIVLAIVKPFSKDDKSDTQVEMQGIDFKITTEIVSTEENATPGVDPPYQDIASGVDLLTEVEVPEASGEPWEISVSDIPEYDALIEFLTAFEWYRDNSSDTEFEEYDSSTAADGSSNILENVMRNPGCVTSDGVYDGVFDKGIEWSFHDDDPTDPRGYSSDPSTGWEGFSYVSEDGLRWIASNIFNVSDQDFESLYNDTLNNGMGYLEDGRYYYAIAIYGEGLVFHPEINSVKTDGVRYYISYEEKPNPEYYGDSVGNIPSKPYTAEMELKNIDGKNYWSLYNRYIAE